MASDPIPTRCPACDQPFGAPGAEVAECPFCGWEFVCDDMGGVEEDGGIDREAGLALDDNGEPEDEGLLPVTCPHCVARFAVGEAGVHPCPRCRRTVPVDEIGGVADHTAVHFDCFCCGRGVVQTFVGAEEALCLVCGASYFVLGPCWDDLGLDAGCPACGYLGLQGPPEDCDEGGPFSAPAGDGVRRCLDCGHVFWLASYWDERE